MTFGIDVFGATSYTTLQADTLLVSNHWSDNQYNSALQGGITNHPSGNPTQPTTNDNSVYQIRVNPYSGTGLWVQPFLSSGSVSSNKNQFPNTDQGIANARKFIEDKGAYYIDRVSDASSISTTTTSGRSSSTKSKKSKSTKRKKSVWKRLRKRFKW